MQKINVENHSVLHKPVNHYTEMTYKIMRAKFLRFSTGIFALVVLCLAGCESAESKSADSTQSGDAGLRVALLTPGPVSDNGWNAGAYAGLQRIKDSLGARISHIQTKTPAEFDENFRLYGEQGYALVIGHGFEYQDAAQRVSPDFPRTVYVTTSGNRTGANFAGLEFAFEDGAYLAGIVAGATTRSGTIGAIGGQEIPPVKRSFHAFEAGAKSVNPTVKVLVSYIGNWDDASAGKEQALAQIGRGADIIFQNADAAGLGIFQAARESKTVRIIGSNSDQNAVAPEVVLGSVVIDLPHALLLVAREVQSGTFKPRVISLGMPTDVVKLVLNPGLRTTIPASALNTVDSITKLLVAGKFAAPTPPPVAASR
jgi:basic membrane protein A and related proteins